MTHENCESYRELLAAGALTALDPADARVLDTHLESCADCRLEMNEWQKTATVLALEAEPLEPSALLRDRILASVRAEGREQSARADAVNRQQSSRVIPFERPKRDTWASLRSFGAIAAALVFVALIVSLFVVWQQNRRTRDELARLGKEMEQTRAQLDRQRAMVKLITSPDS